MDNRLKRAPLGVQGHDEEEADEKQYKKYKRQVSSAIQYNTIKINGYSYVGWQADLKT